MNISIQLHSLYFLARKHPKMVIRELKSRGCLSYLNKSLKRKLSIVANEVIYDKKTIR